MKPLKVVHIQYTEANPYQYLLIENLRKSGVDAVGARFNSFKHTTFGVAMLSNVKKHKPDIIHIHWQHPFLLAWHPKPISNIVRTIVKSTIFFWQLLILKMMKIKIVWTVHNLKNHENYLKRLDIFLSSIFARMVDAIIVHCEEAAHLLQKRYKLNSSKKINIIPHGNYIGYYENTISREEAREKLNIPGDILTFLFLGELRYYKGIIELIEAFQKLNTSYPDTQLLIAGRPYEKGIDEEIRKRINGNDKIKTFFQYVNDSEMQIFINASDVMVFPYREILTSGGVLLAMSFGKPVIAPRMGCIINTLDSGGSFLYSPDDSEGLFNALNDACISKPNLKEMGDYNLELANQLDWNHISTHMMHLYNKCLKIG